MENQRHKLVAGKACETLSRILEHVLRDESFLLAITRDYRWSVTGPNLYSLHRLFDEQRRQLDYWLHRVMERTKSIGVTARSLVEKNPRSSSSQNEAGERLRPRTMIGNLLSRHEALARRLRDDIERLHDPTTADLLLHLAEFHETTAWMLRMVQNGPDASRTG